jgi:hypothetical protein
VKPTPVAHGNPPRFFSGELEEAQALTARIIAKLKADSLKTIELMKRLASMTFTGWCSIRLLAGRRASLRQARIEQLGILAREPETVFYR